MCPAQVGFKQGKGYLLVEQRFRVRGFSAV